ncbi:MAG: Cysteine desulfuration protein SufE [Verrucomicrobiota bacterium]
MISEPAVPETLAEREAALVATLMRLRDPQSRFAWLVERARERPHLSDDLRLDAHRVTGCQVRLWWIPGFRGGRCWFQSDSDAVTLRALTGMWCDLACGASPAELAEWNPDFAVRLGLMRQMAESRQATVLRVAAMIRDYGAALGKGPE